jgi:hypothetical protein
LIFVYEWKALVPSAYQRSGGFPDIEVVV